MGADVTPAQARRSTAIQRGQSLARAVSAAVIVSSLIATRAATAAAAGPVTIPVPCNEVALENAITAADASATGAVLNLKSDCTYALTDTDNTGSNGANALPVVTNLITVNGHGDTITAGTGVGPFRILDVEAGGNVVLTQLTISGGDAGYGAGVYVGDGAVVAANGVTVSHNVADTTLGQGIGGGLYIVASGGLGGGTLTLSNSRVIHNTAVEGGGLYNLATTIVSSSQITGNSASCSSVDCGGNAQGGGLWNGASLTLLNSMVKDNTASCVLDGCGAEGGGIASGSVFAGGLVLQHTTMSRNTTSCSGVACLAQGGGIWSYGTTVLSGSPVNENTSSCAGSTCAAWGGGVVNSGSGTMTLAGGSKVTKNRAIAPGGTAVGGGLFNGVYGATVHLMSGSNVEENIASAVGGTAAGGGIFNVNPTSGSVTLTQVVVMANSPDQCGGTPTQGC